MSRLLFAAARKARLQREVELLSGKFHWENVGIQWGLDDELRIHPDDEHLQYGPISTALRFNAESAVPDDMLGFGDELGTWVVDYGDWCAYRDCDYRLHRSLFLLILAEALADEGL